MADTNKIAQPPTTLYQFAGEKAKSADLKKLNSAKNLFENHVHNDAIRRKTGWFKGADEKWRFEIDDSQVSLDMEIIDETLRAGDGDIPYYRLGDVLYHPELFKAYPQLSNITLFLNKDMPKDHNGTWQASRGTIELNPHKPKDELEKTLVHELQHSIQNIEGFALGGNTDDVFVEQIKDMVESAKTNAKAKERQWLINNVGRLISAEDASRKAKFALLYRSSKKLLDYSKHAQPTRLVRFIRSESGFLTHNIFRDGRGMNREAYDIDLNWYNMPKYNRNGEKTLFLREHCAKLSALYMKTIPEDLIDEFERDPRKLDTIISSLSTIAYAKHQDLISEKEGLTGVASKSNNLAKYVDGLKDPYAIYWSLAGEVEARLVSDRLRMTLNERAATSPITQSSVPYNAQIIRMHDDLWKGSATFGSDTFAKITLNKLADASTVIHEGAHVFLEVYSNLYPSLSNDNPVAKEFEVTLGWMGITPDEWYSIPATEKEKYHEQFARGFESYMMKGGEDSHGINSIFSQLKTWLVDIYQSLANIPDTKPLTPEIEKVFEAISNKHQRTDKSDFGDKLANAIQSNSNISRTVALATSEIIDHSYSGIAKRANIPRNDFNKMFNIEIVQRADELSSNPSRKHSMGITFSQ